MARTRTGLAFLLILVGALPAGAQVFRDSTPKARIEGRLDALIASRTATEVGAGIFVPLGTYVRVGVVAGIGPITNPVRVTGRGEIIGRFLLDPLYEHRWGPYVAGGLGVGSHPYVLVLLGLEGPRWGAITPAVEGGFGSGIRLGVVLKRSQTTGWR